MDIKVLIELLIKEQARELCWQGACWDCAEPVKVEVVVREDGDIGVSGGAVCDIDGKRDPRLFVVKCDACFKKNPKFGRRTEVYSRVVGYLRPINQWNKGKQAEWHKRTTLKINNEVQGGDETIYCGTAQKNS
mgnify:CR=1 FL=1